MSDIETGAGDNNNHGAGDLRADLEASAAEFAEPAPIDRQESAEPAAESADSSAEPAEQESKEPTDQATEGRQRDEYGRFIPKQGEKAPKAAAASSKAPPKPDGAPKNGAPPQTPDAVAQPVAPAALPAQPTHDATPAPAKAPQSWRPAAREQWAKLPAEVQTEVARREREVATTLEGVAEAKKVHQSFREVVGPYEAMIRSEGGEPMQAVGSLLQTAMALRTAPPGHKAQLVAGIIRDYGIDIQQLDTLLAGGQPGQSQGQPQQAQAEYRDPRVDQLFQQIEEGKRQRAAEQARQTEETINSFKQSHEFFDDVRGDMHDLIEAAGKRGVALSLDDAYSRACKLHPEISNVLQQRESAKTANASQASTQRARDAASSVRSSPANVSNGVHKGSSIMDDIMAARAEVYGR